MILFWSVEKDTNICISFNISFDDHVVYFQETRHIKRKVPSMLKEGEPNLLLVPKGLYDNIHILSA